MIGAFAGVHVIWRVTKFNGDQLILPIAQLLCGLGLIMMVSLCDPLRDELRVANSAWGIMWGCFIATPLSLFGKWLPFVRKSPLKFMSDCRSRRWLTALFLLILSISLLLYLFGSGPGESGVKVNLWIFQPVEFIKIIAVLFLAAYFAERWEYLRQPKHKRAGFPALWLIFFSPVMGAMTLTLALFWLQRDLGPALILACVFLTLYIVVRKRWRPALTGLLIFFAGVGASYYLEISSTLNKRIDIYRNVWDNGLYGGDQIAHSLWAMASGGLTGMGLGLGEPYKIPAAHTDLIVSAIGEEMGFAGVAVALTLYSVLIARAIGIAIRAADQYRFFLVLGLTLIIAYQIILIVSGILGLFPLSGVVSPFLSYGNSAMLANFVILGLICAVSSEPSGEEATEPFRSPVKWVKRFTVSAIVVMIAAAAWAQVFGRQWRVLQGSLTRQAGGGVIYKYNPRLTDRVDESIPGAIFGANGSAPQAGSDHDYEGIPLASSDCDDLIKRKADFERFGVAIERVCAVKDRRYYPFADHPEGGSLFHLLGDARTREAWRTWNTKYIEEDHYNWLRGYEDHTRVDTLWIRKTQREIDIEELRKELASSDREISRDRKVRVTRHDYSDLLPLWDYRYRPESQPARELRERNRNLPLSIDVRLQLEVARIVKEHAKGKHAAAVVINPKTGDLLASVSYPWPEPREIAGGRSCEVKPPFDLADEQSGEGPELRQEMLDRARIQEYAPGSTFKIVASIAAFRKSDALRNKTFDCVPLSDGRVGIEPPNFPTRVRDFERDRPHYEIAMEEAIIESCNAYFAQLIWREVGAAWFKQTAEMFEIDLVPREDAAPDDAIERLNKFNYLLIQAAYGQAKVEATPFEMARVAATVANGGEMAYGRWVVGPANDRVKQPLRIISQQQAEFLARAMRRVVTEGTANGLKEWSPPLAGKTGTAEVKGAKPHAWFIGFAPYGSTRQIAFAVLVEDAGLGGRFAAPIAAEIAQAARNLGLIP